MIVYLRKQNFTVWDMDECCGATSNLHNLSHAVKKQCKKRWNQLHFAGLVAGEKLLVLITEATHHEGWQLSGLVFWVSFALEQLAVSGLVLVKLIGNCPLDLIRRHACIHRNHVLQKLGDSWGLSSKIITSNKTQKSCTIPFISIPVLPILVEAVIFHIQLLQIRFWHAQLKMAAFLGSPLYSGHRLLHWHLEVEN